MPLFRSPPRRPCLTLELLEGRVVPTGTVTAAISKTGVLSLTGDDNPNGVTVKITGSGATLTPDKSTQINTGGTGNAVPLTGSVSSIKVDLKGGADTLSIDGTADLKVAGSVVLNLGNGDNTLNLITTGKIALGGLTVIAGDGNNQVTVMGATGSSVGGTAKFTYADGGSSTTLDTIKFTGVTVSGGDAVGNPNTVSMNNVTVTKTVMATLGNSNPSTIDFTSSTIGGLKASGAVVSSVMQGTNVNGSIAIKGAYDADFQPDNVTVTGNVALTAQNSTLEATNAAVTINGNLTLKGTASTKVDIEPSALSEVKGNITVTGGVFNDSFVTNGLFKADKNVMLNLGGGDNTVTLGNGTAAAKIGGNLTVKTAAGSDNITLDWLIVSGAVSLATGAGADSLSIEDGSTFAKTFTALMLTGANTISIAQNTGSTGPVTFTGKAKITCAGGNNTLLLGLAVSAGGDANSKAVFSDPTSVLDGGTGINTFDPNAAQFNGITPTHW